MGFCDCDGVLGFWSEVKLQQRRRTRPMLTAIYPSKPAEPKHSLQPRQPSISPADIST